MTKPAGHTIELFLFYFHILRERFNNNTYGDVYFFADDLGVRTEKFYKWLDETYGVEIKKIDEPTEGKVYFFTRGTCDSVISFSSFENETRYFHEAEQAQLIQVLTS